MLEPDFVVFIILVKVFALRNLLNPVLDKSFLFLCNLHLEVNLLREKILLFIGAELINNLEYRIIELIANRHLPLTQLVGYENFLAVRHLDYKGLLVEVDFPYCYLDVGQISKTG